MAEVKITIKDVRVQDLLDFFGKLDPKTQVIIEDNDTGYLITTWHIQNWPGGKVIITSDYSEMENR